MAGPRVSNLIAFSLVSSHVQVAYDRLPLGPGWPELSEADPDYPSVLAPVFSSRQLLLFLGIFSSSLDRDAELALVR